MNKIIIKGIYLCLAFLIADEAVGQQVNKPNAVSQPGTYNTVFTSKNTPPSFNNYSTINYKRQWRLRLPYKGITSGFDNTYNAIAISSVINTTYFNGWGKPLQYMQRGASGSYKKDIITAFDQRPSLTKLSHLPYPSDNQSIFKANPFSEQDNYYSNYSDWSDEGGYGFSKTVTEASNGVIYRKMYSPGKSFTGGNVGTTSFTNFNVTNDYIKKWIIAGNGEPATFASYAGSELRVDQTEGQHGSFVMEYYNKTNQLVCKMVKDGPYWLTTVYVYDDQGRLCWIITPKAYATVGGNATVNATALSNLCYHYVYDKYGNIIERKVPDRAGYEKNVYDKKFRPVLFQTPLLKEKDLWIFNIYDSRDRLVISGTVRSIASRNDWQNWVDGVSNPPAFGGNPLSNEVLLTHLRDNRYYHDHNFDGYPGVLYGPPDAASGAANTCTIEQYNYYDYYDKSPYLSGRSFDTRFNSKYSTSSFHVVPRPYLVTHGLLTGSVSRVQSNGSPNNFANDWVGTVYFYDDAGRLIQTHTKNPWTGNDWDISAIQYTFMGDVCNTFTDHYYPAGGSKSQTSVHKIIDYVSGTQLVESVRQKLDNGALRILSSYTYDSFARARQKVIGTIENQNLEYNIRGQLKAINRDYVNADTGSINKTFGCILSYDYGFNLPRFDGSISGMKWRASGAAKRRAYGYKYDEAARMTGADFTEHNYGSAPGMGTPTTPSWNKYVNDYSVSGITYDLNGNMQNLLQKGMWYNPGAAALQIVDMDYLSYTYNANSNMLDRVEDTSTTNFHLHDFTNGNNGSTDYTYDSDANLQSDKNKGIDSIIYNYQDLPLRIVKDDTCTIDNIYDASGNLLQKTITNGSATPVVYTYFGGFVYRNDTLEYLLHDEGRARWIPDSNFFKYDYFVKDHLGNVRSIITTDPVYVAADPIAYHTGFELSTRDRDRIAFDHIDGISVTKPMGGPGDVMAGELDGDDPAKRIGAAIMIDVTAGDHFNASVQSYYEEEDEDDMYLTEEAMLGTVLEAFTGGIDPNVGDAGLTQQYLNGMLTTDNYSVFNALKANITDPAYPRSYLNYMLFDADLNLVAESSGAVQLTGTANDWTTHNIPDIEVTRNGYLLIYVGREDPGINWFDRVYISHYKSRLLEEQQYYPHGLLVEGGGQSTTPLKNKYLYQGKLLQDELGLELYDFHARQYDPQIGRFWSVDPANQFPSGYTGMGNDPANMIDPTGMVAGSSSSGGESAFSPRQHTSDDPDRSMDEIQARHDAQNAEADAQREEWAANQEDNSATGTGSVPNDVATDGASDGNGNRDAKPNGRVGPFPMDSDLDNSTADGATAKGASSQSSTRENLDGLSTANNTLSFLGIGVEMGADIMLTPKFIEYAGGLEFRNMSPLQKAAETRFIQNLGGNAAGKIGSAIGHGTFYLGILIDGAGYFNGSVSGKKFLINTVVGGIGLKLNPVAGVVYTIGGFHPGGWPGFMQKSGEIQKTFNNVSRSGPNTNIRLTPFGQK